MSYTSTKANGNIRYYSEKHLKDLNYEGLFSEQDKDNIHYGYVAANIHVYSGEETNIFAKTPQGFVFLGAGEAKPETIQLPRISPRFEANSFYGEIAKGLMQDESIIPITAGNIFTLKDITDYLIEYYDIFQMIMADEESKGRGASDSEPNLDMSEYVQTKSGNALSAFGLPYMITLPYHRKQIIIRKEQIEIKTL